MSEKLQELYTRLEAELPDHLKTHLTLEADESHACINIIFHDMGELGKENFKQLRSLLEENYSAAFVNPVFPQKPYYTVKQKPRSVVALPSKDDVEQALRDSLIKKAQALNLGFPDATLLTMPLGKLETLVKVASKVSPQTEPEQTKPLNDAKPEPTKQASPLRQYFINNGCAENCEGYEVCCADTTYGAVHICLEVKKYEIAIQQAFDLEHAKAEAATPAPPQVQPKQTQQQPQQNKGKGTVDEWISALKWEPAKTSTGKDCEKAYELSNLNGNLLKDEYVHLLDELKRRKAANEKNVFANYLFFHTEQGESPYIGRMRSQPQGGRR